MLPWAEREARRIGKARMLLEPALAGLDLSEPGRVWADLGCGNGIFTSALASFLPEGDELYAVDKEGRVLSELARNLVESYPHVIVHTRQADFRQPLSLPPLDGLLMANSLHFIRRKERVFAQIVALLKPGGRAMLVEYNTTRGNFAVPHPLNDEGFIQLATAVGLHQARIAGRIPATFLGEMYVGLAFAPSLSIKSQNTRLGE